MKRDNKIFLLLLILCMVMFAAAGCRKEPDRPSQTDGTLTVDDWESGTSGSTDWDQTEQTEQPEQTEQTEQPEQTEQTEQPEQSEQTEQTEPTEQDEQIPGNTETGWGPIH